MTRAQEEYASMIGGALSQIFKREGEFLTVDPAELRTPLTALLEVEDERSTRVDPEWVPVELEELYKAPREELLGVILKLLQQQDQARARANTVLMDYLFARGPDPRAVLEQLFLYVHARSRDHVWGAKSCEIATLFGHTKQNWQHLEEKFIEDLVTRWSRAEFVKSGGKSVAARLEYSKQRQGNTSRKYGRSAGDDMPPLPAKQHEDEPLSNQAKRRARAMRDEAERKKLAQEFGCRPDEIDLTKISLPND